MGSEKQELDVNVQSEEQETEEQETGVVQDAEETGPVGSSADSVYLKERDTETDAESPGDEPDKSEAQDELRRLGEERDQYRQALIQERADFENYKKNNAALASSSFDNGVAAAVSEMLPVMDNFERALAAECSDKAFADGMNMIMRQLQTALDGLGVKEVSTEGRFDPTKHHAVMQTEDPELEPDAVSETLRKGYTLKDRLLRPAMVKVNK